MSNLLQYFSERDPLFSGPGRFYLTGGRRVGLKLGHVKLRTPARAHRLFRTRRMRQSPRPHRQGEGARNARRSHYRPREHVRGNRLLPGRKQGGRQADNRHGSLLYKRPHPRRRHKGAHEIPARAGKIRRHRRYRERPFDAQTRKLPQVPDTPQDAAGQKATRAF